MPGVFEPLIISSMLRPWVSQAFQDTKGLRTEDVSRISYELWSAVDHCAKNKVMHRDIKPENIMFVDSSRGSQLRLIDFGSGRCDGLEQTPDNDVDRYTTFAGSAFYISPEMFQHSYTNKTDVSSSRQLRHSANQTMSTSCSNIRTPSLPGVVCGGRPLCLSRGFSCRQASNGF